MRSIDLVISSRGRGDTRGTFRVERVLLAGYTGRDQESVEAHVEELRALGVPAPERVPAIFEVPPANLRIGDTSVAVTSNSTSGEVEFFLISDARGAFVGVGSDHTDRGLEPVDMLAAKTSCPKVVSRAVWPLTEVRDHWDELLLRSSVTLDATPRLYQDAPLRELLTPEDLEAHLAPVGYTRQGRTLVFGGTVPTIGGCTYGEGFRVELSDPVLARALSVTYRITVETTPAGAVGVTPRRRGGTCASPE